MKSRNDFDNHAEYQHYLRTCFASDAMQGLITFSHSPDQDGADAVSIDDICSDAVRYADSLLKALKSK